LCITSTDGGVLCGNQVDLSFIRYGGFSLKKDYAHEMGLRVLIQSLATAAGRYKRSIRVLAAFSIDFYFRMFVQVLESPEDSLAMVDKIGHVFQCCRCEYHRIQPISGRPDGLSRAPKPARLTSATGGCPECTGELQIGGPIWTGPIYDEEFVEKCMDIVDNEREVFDGITSWTKINGLLHGLRNELVDIPLFYSIPALVQAVKCSPPKLRVFAHYLREMGYRVGGSHRTTNSVKTDAPSSVVFDLLRSFVSASNRLENLKPMVPEILDKPITTLDGIDIDWNIKLDAPKSHVPIYLPNPKAFWGPKARACTTGEFSAKVPVLENDEKKQRI
jgi:tRNA (guanine26-N2/guanine27-N2)-dimethyltransferase